MKIVEKRLAELQPTIPTLLELPPPVHYSHAMSDPTNHRPTDWLADLEISEAQLAAGQTVGIEPALQRLRASIARLEAKPADKAPKETSPKS